MVDGLRQIPPHPGLDMDAMLRRDSRASNFPSSQAVADRRALLNEVGRLDVNLEHALDAVKAMRSERDRLRAEAEARGREAAMLIESAFNADAALESLRAQVSNAQMALSLAGFGGDLLAQIGAALDAVERARDANAAANAHAEALRGRVRELEGRTAELCPECVNSGATGGINEPLDDCPACGGSGAVMVPP